MNQPKQHIKYDAETGKLEMDTALSVLDTEAIYRWGGRIIFEERLRIITELNKYHLLPEEERTLERLKTIFEGESNGEK